jgi:hypothetical protein
MEDSLPKDVVQNIQRILNLENDKPGALEDISGEFNPATVLNVFFPNGTQPLCPSLLVPHLALHAEESLGQMASVQEVLSQTEKELQKEIRILQDEMNRNKDPNRMQLIQEMISVRPFPSPSMFPRSPNTYSQDLLSQMSLIREKAVESEAVVRNITKDIQVLDHAKKNLILSMTTLKRLQMLGVLPFFLIVSHGH